MNIIRIVSATMMLISSVVIVVTAATQQETNHDNISPLPSQCTLYLAPSTIEGAGLGIFTSIPRDKGAIVGVSDVIIPIIDLQQHHRHPPDFFWVLTEYVWDGLGMMGMHSESVHEPLDAYAPGLDCAINCHLGLLNVERSYPAYDTDLPHRSQHPSAGSMTAYWNSTTYTTTMIPAGAELFKYYGDSWFESRAHVFPHVPLRRHYQEAVVFLQDIVTKWIRWGVSEAAQNDMYRIIVSMSSSPLLNALPSRWEHIHQALQEGLQSTLQPHHVRREIQDMPNARCMESIIPGRSHIDGAGRGGFAAWNFTKGQVITGSPLIHILDKELLEMYTWEENMESTPPEQDGGRFVLHSHQLLLNYCWGHPQTTLLLCPYGSGVNYINHAPSRRRRPDDGDDDGSRESHHANVQIRWAPTGHMGQNNSWLEMSLEQLKDSRQPMLAWDFVALRDIDQGEELLLDYGDEWVSAWSTHVHRWHAKKLMKNNHNNQTKMNATTTTTTSATTTTNDHDSSISEWYNDVEYKSAAEWNDVYEKEDIRTERIQKEHPYPDHIDLVCHKNVHDNTYHLRQTRLSANELWTIAMDGEPCVVKERFQSADGETYYTVEMMMMTDVKGSTGSRNTRHHHYTVNDGMMTRIQRMNVHRNMFRFRDVHYTTDMHLEGVFRHEATIPDDMLPKAWRNQPQKPPPPAQHQQQDGNIRHDEF